MLLLLHFENESWILKKKMLFTSTKGAWRVGPRESETERE